MLGLVAGCSDSDEGPTVDAAVADGAAGDQALPDRGADLAPDAPARCTTDCWSEETSGTAYDLNGLWGFSADDVYAVGQEGTILRRGGTGWAPMTSGIDLRLHAIWGTSASDLYATGQGGIVLEYKGSEWSVMSPAGSNRYFAIWGVGGKLFVAGMDGYMQGLLAVHDGSWSLVDLGEEPPILNGLWGSGPDDVYAVGDFSTILHLQGGQWSEVQLPGTKPDAEMLYAVHGSAADNVWVTGSHGRLIHQGTEWAVPATYEEAFFRAIWVVDENTVYAAGSEGRVWGYHDGQWAQEDAGVPEDKKVHALWGTAAGEIFAAGEAGILRRRLP
jgi:hypothetical protein